MGLHEFIGVGAGLVFAGGRMSLSFYGALFGHVEKKCSSAWDGVQRAGHLHALTQIMSWQRRRP